MKLQNGVKKRRQISALERLEKQLLSGQKMSKKINVIDMGLPKSYSEFVTLSDKDIKRIKQEITTLKSRI